MRRLFIYITLFFFGLTACVDPFEPPPGNYEELLVVDAFLTDADTVQSVLLSLSYPIDTVQNLPVSNARVTLQDDAGNTFEFSPDSPGKYSIQPGEFNPEIGRNYVLNVELGPGRNYISSPVTMRPPQAIDEVFYEPETFLDSDGNVVNGYKVAINSSGPAGETAYFRYEWEETFETTPPFGSSLVYDRDTGEILERTDNISVCWVNNQSSSIILATTDGLNVNEIRDQAIRYVSFESAEINQRYSILVKQIPLTKESFEFWKSLRDSNETGGSLFDTQPFPLTGNVRNLDDPQEAVLGYFDIASVSSERIFIDNSELPDGIRPPTLFESCIGNPGDTVVLGSQVPDFDAVGYLISYFDFPFGYVMVPRRCIDCTTKGSNVRPDFWID